MSDEKVIEATETPQKSSRSFWLNIGVLCSAFSIIVLILVGGYGGWYLLNANMHLAAEITRSQYTMRTLQAAVDSAQQTALQSADEIQKLKQTVTALSQEKQGNQEKWLLTEAHYYTKFANDHLQFSRNIPLAIFLLKTADEELSRVVDPKAADIRKAIATDIAALQAIPPVDVAGLYMRLSAINNQLDQLPLHVMRSNVQSPNVAHPNEATWQRVLRGVWQSLQSIVIVRYNSSGSTPLVTPEQKALLYQNVHAILAQSSWALLHQQSDIYQSSLQQLTVWVNRYFALDAPQTRALLNEVSALLKIDIHPPTPTLTNTLQAFNGV